MRRLGGVLYLVTFSVSGDLKLICYFLVLLGKYIEQLENCANY